MLSSYYPTSPDEGSETSIQSSCGVNVQPYWSNIEMNPWMNSDMHPSMISGGGGIPSNGQYNNSMSNNNTWGQSIPTSAPDQAWAIPYDYGSMNHHHIQTSRDASPNEDYFGTVDYNNQDQSSATSWDPNSDMEQPMFSPYSEVPPQIAGLNNSTNMSISPMNLPQYPYSSAQINMATSPPTAAQRQSSSNSTKPSSKSKSPKTTSSKPSSSNKRKASASSSKNSREQSKSNKMHLPQEVHRIASEHISREAWRICKAEAIEMEQRRVQLLQNGSGNLEREMLEQRHNLSMIRQGVMREQGVLEDALRRAEKLGRA